MKSFSLIRTNPKLTTNVKLVVNTNYELFLESFDSNTELSQDRFKKFQFNKNNFYDELVPYFYKGIPASTAFSVKYSDDSDKMFTDYEKQYDDIYLAGCGNIGDTDYTEEFECLAPIHFDKLNFPTNFVIFRVDGPGIIDLTKDNFREEILNRLKCVSLFDLTSKTPIGEFIERNFKKNDSFPETPFELDVRKTEFSKWNGIEYESGGYSSKSLFLEDWLEKEKPFFEFDKFITDGYQDNKVVYPNILNMKFLFDDTPSDKVKLRKWSINRYLGFYLDSMDIVKSVSLYSPYELDKSYIIASDNIFTDISGRKVKPIVKDWDNTITYYVEYNGEFYRIERFLELGDIDYTYKIISNLDLSGKQSELNKNIITIDDNNLISYNTNYNLSTFDIDGFDKADVWLIKIDSKYHTLVKDISNNYVIQTDYGFRINNNKLEYFINESDPSYTTLVDLANLSDIDTPQIVSIFRLNFTAIKDFDTSIINTDWVKYEYEIDNVISDSDEPKLYKLNISDSSDPKQFDDFIYNNDLSNIPVTSEYIASSEIFETLQKNTILSDIWRKNSVFTKWGYQGSIANNDYVYKANNSLLGDDFNRLANIYEVTPNRFERNLDYFYTLNPSSNEYTHHSLHVTDYNSDYSLINTNFSFNVELYMNTGTISVGTMSSITYQGDYFNYLFSKKEAFKNGDILKNSNKYSTFNYGDNVVTNSTLFRGIKFNTYKVSNLLFKSDGQIDKISIEPTSDLDNYKLSVILTENNKKVTNSGIIDSSSNIGWKVIEEWELGKLYNIGDLVVYLDMIWVALDDSLIENGNYNPSLSADWELWDVSMVTGGPTCLWSVNPLSPPTGFWIYRYGEYYYYEPGVAPVINSFWLPTTSYTLGDKTIYKNIVYESTQASTNIPPVSKSGSLVSSHWKINLTSENNRSWHLIEQWVATINYAVDRYVVYRDSLYQKITTSPTTDSPNVSSDWKFIYSIEPNTDRIYGTTKAQNNLIRMNGYYYLCTSNPNSDTLDNGIDIYINKKWKNVLINIYVNDNTLDSLSNTNRDDIYKSIYANLTAKNFMDAINDLDNKYGFTDYIRYIIVDKDGSYNVYSLLDNLTSLPYLIEVQGPDELQIRTDSYKLNGVSPNKNLFKVNRGLVDNEISDVSKLNYYNGDDLGVEFIDNKGDIRIVDNISGSRNINYMPIYRYSGDYMPIFQEIELFSRVGLNNDDLIGNYKFDTSLSKFGIMSERIFSKVNMNDDILKFRNLDSYNSIYPMIDEFGYSFTEHFIFKSTWDKKYYISTENNI